MKEMMLTQLQAVYQRVTTRHRANQALHILALLTIGLWFSACDRNDDVDPKTTAADARLAQRIDSMWIASMQDGTVPGMSVVVIKGGQTFFQKGYGYADLQTKAPVTNDTRFAIGSTTKAMTAMAVLSLVDKGLVKLNEKVATYIPDFMMKDERYREITVSQLLSHSSGIKTFTALNPPDNSAGALEGILPILANEDLAFAPGQGFFYSNYGSTLAGLLVQRVSGKPYETYMDEFLFDPIGMPNTTMEYWQLNALRGTKGYLLNEQNRLMESRQPPSTDFTIPRVPVQLQHQTMWPGT